MIDRNRLRSSLLIGLAAAAAAGGFAGAPVAAASPDAVASASPRPYALACPTAVPTPLERGETAWLVEVEESGGLLYRHTRALVRADGAMWVDGCAVDLDAVARARITAAVETAAAESWPRSTRTGADCCDQIFTSIRLTLASDPTHPRALGLTSATYATGARPLLALIAAVRDESAPYTAFRRRLQQLRSPAP